MEGWPKTQSFTLVSRSLIGFKTMFLKTVLGKKLFKFRAFSFCICFHGFSPTKWTLFEQHQQIWKEHKILLILNFDTHICFFHKLCMRMRKKDHFYTFCKNYNFFLISTESCSFWFPLKFLSFNLLVAVTLTAIHSS